MNGGGKARSGVGRGWREAHQPGADPAAFPASARVWLLLVHQCKQSTCCIYTIALSPSLTLSTPICLALHRLDIDIDIDINIGRPVHSGLQDSRSSRTCCCWATGACSSRPHPAPIHNPHPDPAIPVSSSHPISIPTQISHSKSGHSDAALRLNPPPSRNTTALPPLRNKRALAMPWAWTSPPTAMASSSSSSRFSPSSSASASLARAASTLLSSPTRTTVYLALVALCLPMALGHDHSVENIPDGDATSPEPIVRQTISPSAAVFPVRLQTADLNPPRLCRTRHYGLTSLLICWPLACCSLSAWCLA